MKQVIVCITSLLLLAAVAPMAIAQEENSEPVCVTIQDGTLMNTAGDLLETGYDMWGYNYQAHMFNGNYCDAYRDAGWCQAYRDDELIMKWNDAWLSNQDCTGEGLLDRYYGHDSYRGSGAWLTNHMSGKYWPHDLDSDGVGDVGVGKQCRWNYFVKIVAAPTGATNVNGVYFDESGDEIGPAIWGAFAVVQEVEKDPCLGFHGLQYKGARPGLGNWEDPAAVE